METRINLTHSKLLRIQSNLKERGYTLEDIRNEINADFRNFLYKEHSMSEETFKRLCKLVEEPLEGEYIDYIDGKGEKEELNITKSCKTAELIGIILGDGYLQSKSVNRGDRFISAHRLVVTIHEDEEKLRERTKSLISQVIGIRPSIYDLKNQSAIQIAINSKEVIDEFVNLGLETGDKKDNQVCTPSWIKSDEDLMKACLRGLLDRDGTVFRQSIDDRLIIQFKNHSKPLLEDFEYMCSELEIKTSSGGNKVVQVARQSEVQKFLDRVNPIKST